MFVYICMHIHTLIATSYEPKIQVTTNEAYASIKQQKPDDTHIYEELTTLNQAKMTITMNEAYAYTRHSNH